MNDCIVIGNTAVNAGAGLAVRDAIAPVFVTNCAFVDNSGPGLGGAVSIASADVVIDHCTFIGNTASISGGGLIIDELATDVIVRNCHFENNTSPFGGGLRTTGAGTVVEDCEFVGNHANVLGGGLFSMDTGTTVRRCRFEANTASSGGAIASEGNTTIERSIFAQNIATSLGGAVIAGGFTFLGTELDHCTFYGNQTASGVGPALHTFAAGASVRHAIFWANGSTAPIDATPGTFSIEYSLVQGGYPGEGIIDTDPLFVNAPQGDFSLAPTSPAIDAGDPEDPRDPDGTTPDLGAIDYQVGRTFIRGDANNDSQVDISDTVAILFALFIPATPPLPCRDAADLDDDARVNIGDVIYQLNHLFVPGAPVPVAPFPDCANDLTPDPLSCESSACP